MPLTGSVVEQMMARFHKFRTGAMIHSSGRNIFNLAAL